MVDSGYYLLISYRKKQTGIDRRLCDGITIITSLGIIVALVYFNRGAAQEINF